MGSEAKKKQTNQKSKVTHFNALSRQGKGDPKDSVWAHPKGVGPILCACGYQSLSPRSHNVVTSLLGIDKRAKRAFVNVSQDVEVVCVIYHCTSFLPQFLVPKSYTHPGPPP